MKLVNFLLLILFITSCKQSINNSEITVSSLKEEVSSKEFEKSSDLQKIKINKELYKKEHHGGLYDVKLIGLSIKEDKEVSIYKKYWLDFYSTCMWSSKSVYIDTSNDKIHFFDFSEDQNFNIDNENNVNSFEIIKVESTSESIKIEFQGKEKGNKHDLVFAKIDEDMLYNLKLDKQLQNSDIVRHKFFINKSEEPKFSKEGCDEFDG